jgi:hypothetical protein
MHTSGAKYSAVPQREEAPGVKYTFKYRRRGFNAKFSIGGEFIFYRRGFNTDYNIGGGLIHITS